MTLNWTMGMWLINNSLTVLNVLFVIITSQSKLEIGFGLRNILSSGQQDKPVCKLLVCVVSIAATKDLYKNSLDLSDALGTVQMKISIKQNSPNMSTAPGRRAWFLTLTFKLTDDETTDLLRNTPVALICLNHLNESFRFLEPVRLIHESISVIFGQDQVW